MVLSLAEVRKRTPLQHRALVIPAEVPDVAVAEILGVTAPTVGNWRSGRHQPQPRHRDRISRLNRLISVVQVAEMRRLRREIADRTPTLTVHTG
jgi:DNA-binding transcriptional regulator YdaS (Cro superfamily)